VPDIDHQIRARTTKPGQLHIQELWLPSGGGWCYADLSQLALSPLDRIPIPVGSPAGYATPWDRTARVVYRGDDAHIHELWYG
jgi:hypothetical protein